ncbi:hypothetical protein CVT26_014796 [Gymnopilus dilepis]|uniref:Uncharacterized protein n=1 Tax=Gymnopilus dilepis TaxID=231916 RepID=A0A409W9S3_9AGAR|nr:hypothetical protein CVT26_014796 [Gymnopilus dilepis]
MINAPLACPTSIFKLPTRLLGFGCRTRVRLYNSHPARCIGRLEEAFVVVWDCRTLFYQVDNPTPQIGSDCLRTTSRIRVYKQSARGEVLTDAGTHPYLPTLHWAMINIRQSSFVKMGRNPLSLRSCHRFHPMIQERVYYSPRTNKIPLCTSPPPRATATKTVSWQKLDYN